MTREVWDQQAFQVSHKVLPRKGHQNSGEAQLEHEHLYSHFYLQQAELPYVIETGGFSSSFGGYVLNGDKFRPLPQRSRKSKTLFRGGVRAWGGTALRLEVYVGKVD